MALEVERKYEVLDFEAMRQMLRKAGAQHLSRHFEENLVLDSESGRLREEDKLLRLRRTGNTTVLCLKKPPQANNMDKEYKRAEETETAVSDMENTREILAELGYTLSFRYEKLREKWRLREVRVCLDHLPFGNYVELEGDEESIPAVIEELGLAQMPFTTLNYHQLHKQYLRQQGMAEDDSFVFSAGERQRLQAETSG